MIILMSFKQWKKSYEKLAEQKEYVVFDATDREASESRLYGHYDRCQQLSSFRVPTKARKKANEYGAFGDIEGISKEDAIVDMKEMYQDKFDKIFKEHWDSQLGPCDSIHTIFAAQACGEDVHVFVVFRNKDYDAFGFFIKRSMERLLGFDPDERENGSGIVFLYEEWAKDKKFFKNPLKEKHIHRLVKVMKELEEKYEGFDPQKYKESEDAKKRKKKEKKLQERREEFKKQKKHDEDDDD